MWKTALLLIITIIIIPVAGFLSDVPLNGIQSSILYQLLIIYLGAALLCFVVSTATGNHSQVDKLWSLMPPVYAWILAVHSGWEPRIVLMAILITLWGLRLTYNFARRGGYSWRIWTGEEDYRWAILRKRPELKAGWRWTLFNLFFISLYQMGIILLMTLPALRSIGGRSLSWPDLFLAVLFILLLSVETIADQQQWNFQQRKRRLAEAVQPLPDGFRQGFIRKGLWAYIRHPNYASEQGIWIIIYFFSVVATSRWINWSVTGALLLVLLFWGSSDFSESVSSAKYPEYGEYRKRVPRFVPFVRRSHPRRPHPR